jgi:DnaJ-class molecular chaperone
LEALVLVVILVLLGGAFYYVSLKLNPWMTCPKCHGQPRIKSWVFDKAHHTCPKCDGTGRVVRPAYRFFKMGRGGQPPR